MLRSWIGAAGLAESTAWVSVQREERNPQRFWVSVLSALRQTAAGSTVVGHLTPAPDLDGWAVVERLLKDLESLQDQAWLVIDDVHELRSAEALRQLELLLMRAPPELRCVLATRHDMRLGLHRLRLEGEVTEIRAANLRFTFDEARALFSGAGVELPESALTLLHVRTEGWAAGLRLAALSLAGHPDPERFAAEFSGSERTVAEYLLAEVLERQSEEVRRLLLRTSMLERVSGELADLLTIGAAAGAGLLAVAALATGLVLVALEGPHLPLLRLVDARRWSPRFRNDEEPYRDDDTAVLPDTVPPADRDQQTSPTPDDVGPRVRGLPPAWLSPPWGVVLAGRARYAARSENKTITDGQGSARPQPSAAIAPDDGSTGAIAFLFAVARGGLE